MNNRILQPPGEEIAIATPEDRGNTAVATIVGTSTAVAFGLGGFFLVNDYTGSMGKVLFVALPLATGFATALVSKGAKLATACLLVGALICTAVLLITRMEGFVCLLMSTPLLAIALTIGALLGALFRHLVLDKLRKQTLGIFLTLAVLPFFLMGA